ncbi:MAG: 23S rRNA (adenine(2030)-N(6))-methyltransferase RlmJ [Inquilinus limosus]|uniref:Ribosomal RNA large subunit methyltransferase J n=1 Tax=Inquilinus limosus TaxID=171674 RepID=A0A952FQS4_9PROT|nr:23S rRNA (adenine(2030)-N(6))-methyltransferase RlmJ [Inquilinus limosus]
MNYRHAFHAGNQADVLKHVVLVALLEALRGKGKPFSALDLHAGIGRYALAAEASKTGEYVDGIARIEHEAEAPAAVARYLELVRGFNPSGRLEIYPGSPRLIRALMRPGDRLTLVELHPEDNARLRAEFAGDDQIAIHHRDSWESLRGLLPPQPRRGLLLLDPSFEQPDELARLARGIATAHRRWPEGVIAAWYPIKDRPPVDAMLAALPALPRAWTAELTVFDTLFPARLNGSGLVLANLPWGVEDALRDALAWLQPRLARQGGGWRLERLTG